MIERIVIIDSVDPLCFYGVNNANMQLIKNLFPKLRISARGSVIRVIGEDRETAEFEAKIKELSAYAERYNTLGEEVILDIVKGDAPKERKADGVIIYGINGKPISARTPNQARLVETFSANDLTFALGPAGTGKTYIAIALAVRALKNREIRKIILSRPAVEAGAFMRGRTLNDAVIVLDEAQNTTTHQIKMFLTRLGMNARMIVTGDVTQIDLPRSTQSGLVQALRILKDVEGVGRVEFGKKDIVRHHLVQRIVEAYERHDAEEKAARDADVPDHEI